MEVKVFPTRYDLAHGAAEHFLSRSDECVVRKGSFTVALSGGTTPKTLYQVLDNANEKFCREIYWPMIHFFWSDERHVPPNHSARNYRMAYETMLWREPVSMNKIHRIKGENPNPAEAAKEYEEEILKFVPGSPPRFDLILLGLGNDGHTASIFPGSEVLHETKRLVAAPWVEKLKAYRITMTLPLINNAASVVFLVSGAEKAEIVKEVLQGPKRYPAQEVEPINGELILMLDQEAASKI